MLNIIQLHQHAVQRLKHEFASFDEIFLSRAGSTTTTAGGGGGGSDSITTATDTFQPPDEPPPKEKWEKDDETKICRICSVHFGMVC